MSILRDTPTPYMTFVEQATAPATPASGKQLIYPKTDGKWYAKDDAGNEVALGSNSDVMTTKGDLLTRNGSTYVRLGVGSDGQVLTADAAEAAGVKWATPSGGGSLLAEQVITGSAVTSITLSSLDINTNKSYRLEMDIYNPTASNVSYDIFANGDETTTNYYSQYIYGDNTSHASGRENTAKILYIPAGTIAIMSVRIGLVNSKLCAIGNTLQGSGSTVFSTLYAVSKTADIDNLTTLKISSRTAGGIGIGSKVRLYRGDV